MTESRAKKKEEREAARLAKMKKKEEENGVTVLDELPDWVKASMSSEDAERAEAAADSDMHDPDFCLDPGTFKVVLLVDSAETSGGEQGGKSNRKAITVSELNKKKVDFEVRKLNVGDFAWVARESDPRAGCSPRELVLPHVVERKRIDDLIHSIRDTRYKEQKWRMAR